MLKKEEIKEKVKKERVNNKQNKKNEDIKIKKNYRLRFTSLLALASIINHFCNVYIPIIKR